MTLKNFINKCNDDDLQTIVVIGERTHWIFNDGDAIEEDWADSFDVKEIVSDKKTSIIVRVAYNRED